MPDDVSECSEGGGAEIGWGDDEEMVLQDFNSNEDYSEEDYETAIDDDSDDDSVPEDYDMAVDYEVRFRSQKGPMAIDAIMN
ncbi:hypothetical protein PGQ11_006225 [Apiospora arundinis]|uniref:Uncharacterized protein n=1 Tax=Apiospora arundinis TaxID=335852 RepID=A0ABR2IS23_9PEZI